MRSPLSAPGVSLPGSGTSGWPKAIESRS
jgi:hypothetical protein